MLQNPRSSFMNSCSQRFFISGFRFASLNGLFWENRDLSMAPQRLDFGRQLLHSLGQSRDLPSLLRHHGLDVLDFAFQRFCACTRAGRLGRACLLHWGARCRSNLRFLQTVLALCHAADSSILPFQEQVISVLALPPWGTQQAWFQSAPAGS